jgi:hypothetical protein
VKKEFFTACSKIFAQSVFFMYGKDFLRFLVAFSAILSTTVSETFDVVVTCGKLCGKTA